MMNSCQFVVALLLMTTAFCSCQDLMWTWMQGDTKVNASPEGAVTPGSRSGATVWTQGNRDAVWMFGGEIHQEGDRPQVKNDLWKFEMGSKQWSLVHPGHADDPSMVPGPRHQAASCGITGAYFLLFGGVGLDGSALNDTWVYYLVDSQWYQLADIQLKLGVASSSFSKNPLAHGDSASWCLDTLLVIFGGVGDDQTLQHDLWMFDMEQLAWTEAKSSAKLPENEEFVSRLNYPSARAGATTWLTSGNRLFMFGGNIDKDNIRSKHLTEGYTSDLWEYDLSSDDWTFRGGDKGRCTRPGVYGTMGHYKGGIGQWPGCRRGAAAWVDRHSNLWMFGGDGVDNTFGGQHSKLLSDFWMYKMNEGHWIWKYGSAKGGNGGNYGNQGQASKDSIPGARCDAMFWPSNRWGRCYMYGGLGHDAESRDGYLNDLWIVDLHLDPSVEEAPYSGTVFGLIFLGLALVSIVAVLYIGLNLFWKRRVNTGMSDGGRRQNAGTYKPLLAEDEC